jgi:uncharacterized glyoxalase superfamily protein PhnB
MSKQSDQLVYPIVSYEDANAGVEWLKQAFGAEELMVHRGDGGAVDHFELSFEGGIVMGGTKKAGELQEHAGVEVGRASVYLIVSDPDAHHKRAEKAGAEIVIPLRDEDYGSRGYSALDPEGNIWSFGTYRPEAG